VPVVGGGRVAEQHRVPTLAVLGRVDEVERRLVAHSIEARRGEAARSTCAPATDDLLQQRLGDDITGAWVALGLART